MPNLTKHLGGPRLLVKRDDCTGLAMGGNKARQLEFYMGEAMAQGADTVITTGAMQSNHARQTAAAAAKLGLRCEIQLEHRVPGMAPEYDLSGNVLLDGLLGARIHDYPVGEDEAGADRALEEIAERIRAEGGKPYVIHLGADHPSVGTLGYVVAAAEILDQAAAQDITIDAIVTPSGSAATHGGIVAGLRARGSDIKVYGVCVRRGREPQSHRVMGRAAEAIRFAGLPDVVTAEDIWLTDDYLGPGYGQTTPEMMEAVRLAARTEGLLLDPVYTGKAMAGLIGLVRQGAFQAGETVVFLHTGGTPALFAYQTVLSEDWSKSR